MTYAVELPIPRDWQVFEDLCRDLFAAEWGDPETKKHGRSGQKQYGVDVYGRRQDHWQGVQCKRRRKFPESRLTEKQVRNEVEAARRFSNLLTDPGGGLENLVIATTAPADTEFDRLAVRLTEQESFRVVIYGWSDLCDKLQHHLPVFQDWQRKLLGSPKLKPWNVPQLRNPYFTGREEELQALHKTLTGKRSAALGQAIRGLGGIGKTQTAIAYAYKHRTEYEAVLWTRANTEVELVAGFVEIARELDLQEKDTQDQGRTIEAVRRWLKRQTGWLLILDNADTPKLVEPFLPKTHCGKILITSRASTFEVLGIRRPLRLAKMRPDEAVTFLLERIERQEPTAAERSAIEEIARLLDYLPLALEQAGAFMAATGALGVDYFASLKSRRLELLEKGKPPRSQYPNSVATTWSMNFEQVEQTSEAAAEILRLSAFLAPNRIPYELWKLGAPALGETLSSALGGATEDPVAVAEILEPLARFSLIERERAERTFSIHRLVQEVVKETLTRSARHAKTECIVRALALFCPGEEMQAWPLCDRLQAHWRAVTDEIERSELEIEAAGTLLDQAGCYAHVRGQYREAAPFLERSLRIRENVLGAEHPEVTTSLNNLGLLYQAQREYAKAQPLLERALQINEKIYAHEHPAVAISLHNLAHLSQNQGSYAKALALYKRALPVLEKALGQEHPTVATCLNNFGTLQQALGDYEKAASLLEGTFQILEKTLGADHPSVAASLANLAMLYKEQADYEKAIPLLERALRIQRKVLGTEHPDFANSLTSLAVLYRAQGEYAKAVPLVERALLIRQEIFGTYHSVVITSLADLATLYKDQGHNAKAGRLLERVLQSQENSMGPDHPELAATLTKLANFYCGHRSYADALPLCQRALQITEKALGPDHPKLATLLETLASIHRDQGRYADAEPLYRRALQITERALGADQEELSTTLNELAILYHTQRRYAEALPLYQRDLYITEKALGPGHPELATTLENLANLYSDQRHYTEAEPLYQRTLQILEQALPENHPKIAIAMENYSSLLRDLDRDDEAAELEASAQAIWATREETGLQYGHWTDHPRR